MPTAVWLQFWFALWPNWPQKSDGVTSQKTTKPSCISPVDSHFQGNSGSAARTASCLKGETTGPGLTEQKGEAAACSPCERFLCRTSLVLTTPVTSLTETKGCERTRKLLPWTQEHYTQGGNSRYKMWGKSLRKQTDLLENGEESYNGLGGYLWSTVVSSSDSTILWALREDYNPSILFLLSWYSIRWENLHPNSRNVSTITALQA